MANTLYEFYKAKGQNLPSIAERSKVYEAQGLGAASAYQGTYDQNVALLSRLQSQDQPKPAPTPSPAPPVSSPVARVDANASQTSPSPTVPTLPTSRTISGQTVPTNVGLFQQYQTDINARLKDLEAREAKVLEAQRNLPKQSDLLRSAREESGVITDIQRAESLDERLAQLEGSIFESERDIRERIKKSGGFVTESQVQRLAAAETKPLIEEYNRISAERGRLGQRISSKEGLARDYAETSFKDLARELGIAETELEFGQKRYDVYRDIAKDLFRASEADINQIIDLAQSANETERKAAEDEIDLALKLADLAVKTPAGTTIKIGDQTITGVKPPPSSGSSSTLSPTQFNIRSGLAGLTKDQANDVVTKDVPPAWFITQEEQKAQASLSPAELQRRWNEFKGKVQTEAQTSKSSEVDPFQSIIDQALAGLPTE